MSITGYLDRLYDATFEAVYRELWEQARRDRAHAEESIRQTLKSLYVWQGNDWLGRGAVGDAPIDALIAAHECVLAELRTDRG